MKFKSHIFFCKYTFFHDIIYTEVPQFDSSYTKMLQETEKGFFWSMKENLIMRF